MKKDSDELQSRREFFKSSAKAALPVIGAIVFASMPIRVNADAKSMASCYDCSNICSNGCGGCGDECTGCARGCSDSCPGSCKQYCILGCTADCGYTCSKSAR